MVCGRKASINNTWKNSFSTACAKQKIMNRNQHAKDKQ